MQTYLKTKPVWVQALLFLGMAFALFLIAMSVGGGILANQTGIPAAQLKNPALWDLSNPAFVAYMRGMLVLQFFFLFTIPSFIFAYFSDPEPMRYIGLKAPSSSLYWALGLLLMVVAFPAVEYLGLLNQKIPFSANTERMLKGMEEQATKQIQSMLQNRSPLELAKNLVFIALFAGIGEELFFRGILQRMFVRLSRNPWVGIVLTATLFSAFHFQFYGFIPRLFLGVLLGALYWYSGSLWVAILAHFLYDAALLLFIYFNPQVLQNPDANIIKAQGPLLLAGALLSMALVGAIVWQMQRLSAADYDTVYNNDFPKEDDDEDLQS